MKDIVSVQARARPDLRRADGREYRTIYTASPKRRGGVFNERRDA